MATELQPKAPTKLSPLALYLPILLLTFIASWAALADQPASLGQASNSILTLNVLFIFLPSLLVSYFSVRAFLLTRSLPLLLKGSGFLVSGAAALSAGWLFHSSGSANTLVTVHNTGVLLSAICFIGSGWAFITRYPTTIELRPAMAAAAAYSAALLSVTLVTVAAANNLTPLFFSDTGPTPLRQFVLGAGLLLYAQTTALLFSEYRRTHSLFLLCYSLALGLITAGLAAILFQHSVSDLASLIGRTAQYLGYVYAMAAVLFAVRDAKTRQQRTEEALAGFFLEAEENYRALAELSASAVITTDGQNRIASWNSGAEQLFGLSRRAAIGQSFSRVVEFTDEMVWYSGPDTENTRRTEFSSTIQAADGRTVPVAVSMAARKHRGDWIGTYIIRDITEQKRLEHEMARLGGLDMVGQMASAMAHEVRNPITTVRGFLQLLGRRNDGNKEYYDVMIDEIDRANAIISQYLSLARNKTPSLSLASLADIAVSMKFLVDALAMEHGKNIHIATGTESVPDIELDVQEMKQLILNLVHNAIEASPPGGTVTVTVRQENRAVVLAVSDHGPGIPPDLMDKLGTPFLTTKPEGNGLGLAVCYRIVDRHKASIDVKSGPAGTTFQVAFAIS